MTVPPYASDINLWQHRLMGLLAKHSERFGQPRSLSIERQVADAEDEDDVNVAVNMLVGSFGFNDMPDDVKDMLDAWEEANKWE